MGKTGCPKDGSAVTIFSAATHGKRLSHTTVASLRTV